MLIMTLAYSQRSGNGTFLSKHVGALPLSFLKSSKALFDVVYLAEEMGAVPREQHDVSAQRVRPLRLCTKIWPKRLLSRKSADFTDTSQVPKSNQTNLVLKGIIGIACMAKIAELVEVSEDQQHFNVSRVLLRRCSRRWY